MSDQRGGGISWTDQTWNPIRGCSRVSAGCRNCYAEKMAARFSGTGQAYDGLAVMKDGEATWTGKVRLVHEHLTDPIRWKRPRRIFVNSMSDLFHESLRDDEIALIFAVMVLAPRHTFQVLTKRASRMRKVLNDKAFVAAVAGAAAAQSIENGRKEPLEMSWPLPNVWLGVSAEDQRTADERLPELANTPAAVRWLSAEPLLGLIDMDVNQWIDWIVVGGESGTNCREMDIEWARTLRRYAGRRGIAFWMKQLGGRPDAKKELADFTEELRVREFPKVRP